MIDQHYVNRWWARRILQYALAAIACFFLALSLARLLNVEIINWPKFLVWIVRGYGDLLLSIGKGIIFVLSNIPLGVFDLLTAYLLLGALTRLAIIDIGLTSEKSFLDRGSDHWNDDFVVNGIATARQATESESKWFYFFWPVRVYSDVHGKYFVLTPLRISIYFGIVVVILLLAKWLFPA
jgi:hypothetical protein